MLTREEASKCITEMREICMRSMKMLEATAVQAMINGDKESIENGKYAAKKYQEIKNTVDQCINVVQKYVQYDPKKEKPSPLEPFMESR